jgi:hypothetical protein
MACEARVGREPARARGAADDDRGGHRPAAVLGEQPWAVLCDQLGELRLQLSVGGE